MYLSHLIGKTITNIFVFSDYFNDGLDHAQCYLEIDGHQVICIPFSGDTEIRPAQPDPKAENLYHWSNMKHIANQKVADIFWFTDDLEFDEPAYLELANGCIITEVATFPSGAGQAGLRYYKHMEEVLAEKGYTRDDVVRLSGS